MEGLAEGTGGDNSSTGDAVRAVSESNVYLNTAELSPRWKRVIRFGLRWMLIPRCVSRHRAPRLSPRVREVAPDRRRGSGANPVMMHFDDYGFRRSGQARLVVVEPLHLRPTTGPTQRLRS